jgi:signal transduction histidine kinase/CheY-like chemotaxis protein/HPt (histidine-containing phosphotransfer) domain-containing protein
VVRRNALRFGNPVDGLGVRMILIVLLAVAPLATLLIVNTYERRIDYVAATQRRGLDLARLGATAVRDQAREIQDLLNVVVELPVVRNASNKSDCELFLGNLTARYEWVHAIWVARPDGALQCWQSLETAPQNIASADFFHEVISQRRFVIDDVQGSERLTLTGAVPFFDKHGDIAGIVGVAIDIERIARVLDGMVDSDDTIVAVVDSRGKVIAQTPRSKIIDQKLSESPLVKVLLKRDEGTVEAVGTDGIKRIFVFSRVLDTSIWVTVGIDPAAQAAVADRALYRNLALLLLFTTLSVAAAWFGAESLVLKWLRSLSRTMQTIGAGNLDVRAEIPGHLGEIAVLGHEINQMAANLRERTQELIQAKDDAVQASRAKADFLATMSHEIRTPLTGIIGFAELVLEKRLTAEQRRYMSYQRDAARALLEIINDILDFSKIEADMVRLDRVAFNLATVIERCSVLLAPAAEQKGLEFTTEIAPNVPPYVTGDPGRLRQILLNLIGNAVKYTDRGKVVLRVDLADLAAVDGVRQVRFTVSDTGIGIAREQQALLFSKFTQVAGVERAAGGTGLGLVISKRLVELMGGSIGVSSVEGVGSNFWFTLPLPVASAPPLPEMAAPDEIAVVALPSVDTAVLPGATDRTRRGRILVVEDQFLNQELAVAILERAGYTVEIAADGMAALKALESGGHDLVLMDVEMPVMDGIETTRAIRSMTSPHATLPVIALTAHVTSDRVDAALAAGANDHVSKPLDRGLLLEKIEFWLLRSASTSRADAPLPAQSSAEARPQALDQAVLDQLKAVLGEEKTQEYVASVVTELQARAAALKTSGEARQTIREWAHDLISLAGNIGLMEISAYARELELVASGEANLSPLLDRLPFLVDHAIDLLHKAVPGARS